MGEEKQCWPQKEVRTSLIACRLQSSVLIQYVQHGTVKVHLICATFNLSFMDFISYFLSKTTAQSAVGSRLEATSEKRVGFVKNPPFCFFYESDYGAIKILRCIWEKLFEFFHSLCHYQIHAREGRDSAKFRPKTSHNLTDIIRSWPIATGSECF